MAKVGELAYKIRSKNAGPFWLTIDVFCESPIVYEQLKKSLTLTKIASLYQVPEDSLKRFDIDSLNVIKFSFPRATVQGGRFDRDMHGAQMSVLLAEQDVSVMVHSPE